MERYLSFNSYMKNIFGEKIAKLSLDANFSCPNRDGKISSEGCIFCSESGAGEFNFKNFSMEEQLNLQKEIARKKWKAKKFIAYFQNFTNTYADVNYLRKIYSEALKDDEVVGIAIATRADCLEDEVLDLLEELNKKTFLFLEIGMQSINENTVEFINRGYSHKYLDEKLKELNKRNIRFLLHVIFGLPCETKDDMLNSIKYVNESGAFGVKIHSLFIQYDSNLYDYYLEKPFKILEKCEYVDLVCEAISILDDSIVVARITGDADKKKLFLPKWSADKLSVIGEINKNLKEKNITQGLKKPPKF